MGEFRAKAQYSFGETTGRNFTAAANFAPDVAAEEENKEGAREEGRVAF